MTTTAPEAPPARPAPRAPSRPRRIERHRGDLARLVLALGFGLLGTFVMLVDRRTADGISLDIIALVDWMPVGVAQAIVGVIQLLAVLAPVVVVVVLAVRRWFLALAVTVLAAALGGAVLALVSHTVEVGVPPEVAERARADSFVVGAAFPSAAYWGAAVAVVVGLTPWMTRQWRRTAWVFVGLVAIARIATASAVPLGLWPALGLGAAAGSLALLILGAPARRVDRVRVLDVLRRAGLSARTLTPATATTARTSSAFAVGVDEGPALFCKVVRRDDRDAELVSWVWRNIRVKGIEDERPLSSPRRSLEHESLVAYVAADAGVRVACPFVVVGVDESTAVAVADMVDGDVLAARDDAGVSDAVLTDLWRQVARLQEHRIAHRWLNTSNVLVDAADHPWLTGFSYSDQAASDDALAADVAEMLSSLALLVGPERAVATAVAGLGSDRVSGALRLLQPLALTSETRALVRRDKKLLPRLRAEVSRATGVEEVKLEKIERIGWRSVAMVAATVAVVYIMLVQFSEAGDVGEALESANWWYVVPILACSAGTFVAGALSLLGAVRDALPLVRTTVVQLGQTFLNRFTPANAGGMALRVRFLQKRGTSVVDGAAAVGLTSVASGAMQVALFVGFFLAAGQKATTGSIHLPNVSEVALVILVILVLSGIVLVTPWGRRVLVARAIEIIRIGFHTIGTLARSPVKMLLLFGGAGLSKLLAVLAFWASCEAFGIGLPLATIGAVYLTATTIGSAVPTPGGVGGIEAALVACLTAVGVDASLAVPAMLLFRLLTYWLPVVPGYVAFWYLGRVDAI